MIQAEHIFIYKLSRVSSHAVWSVGENSFPLILKRNYSSVQDCQVRSDGREGTGGVEDAARLEGSCDYAVLESTGWFSNCKFTPQKIFSTLYLVFSDCCRVFCVL